MFAETLIDTKNAITLLDRANSTAITPSPLLSQLAVRIMNHLWVK